MLKHLMKGNTTTIILSLLHTEPMYGYQIVKEVEGRSKQYFKLKEGTIYPLLHGLEKQGLVEGRWQRQKNRPNRKYYHLTARGEKILAKNLATWKEFSLALNHILGRSYG